MTSKNSDLIKVQVKMINVFKGIWNKDDICSGVVNTETGEITIVIPTSTESNKEHNFKIAYGASVVFNWYAVCVADTWYTIGDEVKFKTNFVNSSMYIESFSYSGTVKMFIMTIIDKNTNSKWTERLHEYMDRVVLVKKTTVPITVSKSKEESEDTIFEDQTENDELFKEVIVINPGLYGIVEISDKVYGEDGDTVFLQIENYEHESDGYSAQELRDAAKLLNRIAEHLEKDRA